MIAVLRCESGKIHGSVKIDSLVNGYLRFSVDLEGLSPGLHGFHIHTSANDLKGSSGLCSHYNPSNGAHSFLNDPTGHHGDLGNILFNKQQICKQTVVSKFLRLDEIVGRSIVVHSDEDDLGFGDNPESLKTGNSGSRVLWGVIGRDISC